MQILWALSIPIGLYAALQVGRMAASFPPEEGTAADANAGLHDGAQISEQEAA